MSTDITTKEKGSETPEVRKGYNGWSNYETRLVKLWMDNEEGDYNYWIDSTRRAYEDAEEDHTFTRIENAAFALSKELKDSHENIASEQGVPTGGFVADLFNAAISEVNWHEIATSLLEDHIEQD